MSVHLRSVPLYCSAVCSWQFGHGVIVSVLYMVWHVLHSFWFALCLFVQGLLICGL